MPLSVGGPGSPSNTMSPGPRPTSVPSDILIHPTVWLQCTNVTDRTDNTVDSIGRTVTCNSRPKTISKLHEIFCTCCLWPWLGLPLTTMQYVMYFRFLWMTPCFRIIVETKATLIRRILSDSLDVAPTTKSDIYHYLVGGCLVLLHARSTLNRPNYNDHNSKITCDIRKP